MDLTTIWLLFGSVRHAGEVGIASSHKTNFFRQAPFRQRRLMSDYNDGSRTEIPNRTTSCQNRTLGSLYNISVNPTVKASIGGRRFNER